MATTDRILGLTGTRGLKDPCIAATTVNITLSGIQTIDGIVMEADDRVLVKDQSAGAENGIYRVQSGAWTRAPDWDGGRDVSQGTMVSVGRGTENALVVFHVTTVDEITVGTTAVVFAVRTTFGVSAFMETVVDDTSATEARATLAAAGTGSDDTITGDRTVSGATTHSGVLTLSGGVVLTTVAFTCTAIAINEAHDTLAAHASTMDIWSKPNNITATGSAVVFTDFADAPQAGATRWIRMNAAHTLTDGANIEVMGNANYVCEDGDMVRVTAKTTTTFKADIFPIDGESVVGAVTPSVTPPTRQVFTSSGTWSRPTGCKYVQVRVQGGGGSGAAAVTTTAGGGGGAGGYSEVGLDVTSIASVTVTVGAAANASTFGSYATGGAGASGSGILGGEGGVGSVGGVNQRGGPGGTGVGITGGHGGNGFVGGGGKGQSGVTGQVGLANSGAGGAGGGSNGNFAGSGGSGIIIVDEYYD